MQRIFKFLLPLLIVITAFITSCDNDSHSDIIPPKQQQKLHEEPKETVGGALEGAAAGGKNLEQDQSLITAETTQEEAIQAAIAEDRKRDDMRSEKEKISTR